MSEYTNYFAVRSADEQEVQRRLNAAQIRSVVDADKTGFWFSPPFKRSGDYNWVVVSAPANSGFENEIFFYRDQFEEIGHIFDTLIHFFQEEDMTRWTLKLKTGKTVIEKQFTPAEEIAFTENETALFSACFDKSFRDIQPFLQPGKAADFLNAVGIPYMEMNDQDKLPDQLFGDRYALLAGEITD